MIVYGKNDGYSVYLNNTTIVKSRWKFTTIKNQRKVTTADFLFTSGS